MSTRIRQRAYLYKTVYNAALDHLKHQKAKKRYADHSRLSLESEAMAGGDEELYKKLESAIASLPEQRQKVFILNRFERMRYKEIAARLHISEKTVENHMGAALRDLKKIFKAHLPIVLIILTFYIWQTITV